MRDEVFSREPLGFRGMIPVFSESNQYMENYEQIAADHLASLHQDGTNPWIKEYLWVEMENSTLELIKKFSKPNDMILDVGVGLGRLLSHFPMLRRYGMDISLGYLEIAQSKGIDVCWAMIEDMPYKEDLFDIVVCTDVLEHVLDLNLACAKILAVLKKGGFLIVRTPYREELAPYLAPSYPYQYAHLRNFDENSLRLLFERVFNCEYVDMKTAGYDYAEGGGGIRLKCRFRFPMRDVILINLLSALKVIHPPTYQTLLQTLYYPIEINMVFRKM